MKELAANLWETPADLRAVTTNGFVAKGGRAVMGRRCAREAREMIPGIDYRLGELLQEHGNRPMRLCRFRAPTSPRSRSSTIGGRPPTRSSSPAPPTSSWPWSRFSYSSMVIPRPGCGNGSLSQDDVRPSLAGVLDDRFTVVSFR